MVYSPFFAKAHDIYRGLWVNFQDDPYYKMFELLILNRGKAAYLIAYHSDYEADLYYTPGAQIDTDTTVFNTVHFIEKDITYSYNAGSRGIAVSYSLTDKYNREISFALEEDKDFTPGLGMLAPIGRIKNEPVFFPAYMMADLGLVQKQGTKISLIIDGKAQRIAVFPVLVDHKEHYFVRYAVEPVFVDWMTAPETVLQPLKKDDNGRYYDSGLTYETIRNNDYLEIKQARFQVLDRSQTLVFSPPLPELISLLEGIKVQGFFAVQANQITGLLGGRYSVQKRNNNIYFRLNFTKAWQPPNIGGHDLWVTHYQWDAVIEFNPDDSARLSSHWNRIN